MLRAHAVEHSKKQEGSLTKTWCRQVRKNSPRILQGKNKDDSICATSKGKQKYKKRHSTQEAD